MRSPARFGRRTAVDDAFEPVAPGDDFFGGLSEPGLMVIERLNPDKFFAARTSAPGGDGGSRKKAGKTPAKAQGGARDESGAEDDVRREKLLERARKLQEKANRLLREAGAGEADGAGAAGEGRAREGGAKRGRERAESEEGKSGSGAVEGRRGKRAKAKERAEAKAVEAEVRAPRRSVILFGAIISSALYISLVSSRRLRRRERRRMRPRGWTCLRGGPSCSIRASRRRCRKLDSRGRLRSRRR